MDTAIHLAPPSSNAAAAAAAPAQPSSAATESIPATEAQAPGLSRRHVEYGVAAVLLALAVLVVWDNQRIGAGWSDTGPQAGYFPLRVGAVLGICAIAVFVQALRSRSQEQFASWLQLRRVAQVLLPLTAYIADRAAGHLRGLGAVHHGLHGVCGPLSLVEGRGAVGLHQRAAVLRLRDPVQGAPAQGSA